MKSIFLTLAGLLCFHLSIAQLGFKPPVGLPFTSETTEARFGDIDGDHDNDVVFSTYTNSALFVLYNDNGSFTRFEKVIDQIPGHYVDGDPVNGTIAFYLYDATGDGVLDIIANSIQNTFAKSISIFSFDTDSFKTIKTINISEPEVLVERLHCTDMNSDGKVDIILTLQFTDNLFIAFQSNADGSYSEAKIATPQVKSYMSRLGDLNDDGIDDLALVANETIYIFKGDGAGAMTFDKSISAGPISDFHISDANGDGRQDIFVLTGTVFYYEQSSIGSFVFKSLPHVSTPMGRMGVADADNDGDIDVVFETNLKTGYAFLINEGGGSYIDQFTATADGAFVSFEFSDVDGDHISEFLPLTRIQGNIEIFKRSGSQYISYSNTHYSNNSYIDATLEDMNKDGMPDLIMSQRSANSLSVSYNTGSGNFFSEPTYYNVPKAPVSTVIGDYNGDTYRDVLYTTYRFDFDDRFGEGLIISNSSGELTKTPLLPNAMESSMVYSGDFNNDGFDDFVDDTGLNYGKVNGTFTHTAVPNVSSMWPMASADFNNDGFDDVAFSGNNKVAIKFGQSSMGLTDGPVLEGYAPSFLRPANLNNDNFIDIIGGIYSETLISIINNGDGTLTPKTKSIRQYWGTPVVADFDMNGTDDIALGYNENVIDIHFNDGTGIIKTQTFTVPATINPSSLAVGLIDNDEKPDLLIATTGGPAILINDFVPEPKVISTNLLISDRTSNSAKLSFDAGDGMEHLIIIREANANNADPVDGTLYTANPAIGSGSKIGMDNFVVLASENLQVVVTNLKPGTTYYYSLYEYNLNETRTTSNYLTTSKVSGSFKTKSLQTITFKVTDKKTGDADFVVTATTTSQLPLIYELIDGNVTLTENTVSILGPGPVTIEASQAGNDEIEEASAQTTFCIKAEKPIISITQSSPTDYILSSSSDVDNTWYHNGELIENANGKTFVPTEDGVYSVMISYGSCSTESDKTANLITGVDETNEDIEIFPNPATHTLFVRMDPDELRPSPMIMDETGCVFILDVTHKPNGIELNVEGLSSGLYFLKVGTGVAYKFVKQ